MEDSGELAAQLRNAKRDKPAARMEVLVKNKTIGDLQKEIRDARSNLADMEAQRSRGLEAAKEL